MEVEKLDQARILASLIVEEGKAVWAGCELAVFWGKHFDASCAKYLCCTLNLFKML
jgi:hypothetical protein